MEKATCKLNAFGLSDWTMHDLYDVFKRHPKIEKVILFGSRAKGNYRPGSDIDMAVVADIGSAELSEIRSEIDSTG